MELLIRFLEIFIMDNLKTAEGTELGFKFILKEITILANSNKTHFMVTVFIGGLQRYTGLEISIMVKNI